MTYPAIIVLANWLDPDELPNHETRSRADIALAAFHEGIAPRIITSGWDCARYKRPIADVVRDYLIQKGVPADAVEANGLARDTVGDAVFTKLDTPPMVVTSTYHGPRTERIFSFVYGTDVALRLAYSEATPELQASERRSTEAFASTFAGIAAGDYRTIVRRMIARHPFYNGIVYPAIHPATIEELSIGF